MIDNGVAATEIVVVLIRAFRRLAGIGSHDGNKNLDVFHAFRFSLAGRRIGVDKGELVKQVSPLADSNLRLLAFNVSAGTAHIVLQRRTALHIKSKPVFNGSFPGYHVE